METSFLRMLVVFVGWTLTSLACHYCAKLFLNETAVHTSGFNYHVMVLTGLQIIIVFACTQVRCENDIYATSNKYFVFAAHACATLATNWSMSVMNAASTFAIKLMEPLTGAILQRFLLDIRLSYLQWISIPAVVYGAILFTADDKTSLSNVRNGVILAFVSNLCLSLRNVYLKKDHLSKTVYYSINKLGLYLSVFALVVCSTLLFFLESVNVVHSGTVYIYGLLLSASLFHVGYSYISTIIVLKHFSVVGHAFGNILKRFSVLGFLYMVGSRAASTWNFIGLFICATGLVVYTLSKTEICTGIKDFVSSFRGVGKNKLLSILCISASTAVMVSFVKYRTNGSSFDPNMNSLAYSGNLSLSLSKPLNFSIDDFFSVDLLQNPDEANKLSPLLTTRPDVIKEAQRIHQNIFTSLLGSYRYAMIFDYAPFENKGDSAISVGEFTLLRKLNIDVVFACPFVCTEQNLDKAQNMSRNYTDDELIIIFQGGGNVIGWSVMDGTRSRVIPRFMRFKIVMFPQSILYTGPQHHIDFCKKLYATHPSLTFIWRDKHSYILGQELFPKVRSLLSPDMAYQIGFVPRFMNPIYDILWIKRQDKESPVYTEPETPIGLRMHVSDWKNWKTPRGTSPMEDTFLMTTNGMMFVQRGRIVITDRLHGHILSTLLGIPHVYIDNKQRKISNYHNTWTAGIENIIFANSSLDALEKAKHLLIKLDKNLPKIKGFFTNTGK